MTGSNAELTQRWQGALMDNYGTPRLPLVRGEGTRLWDADGKEYLDFVGGIAVNALGHAHPAIVEAVSRQIASLGHVSNLFVAEPPVALAEKLLQLFGREGRVYFCNSGAEANEGAFKIGRLTGRRHMVATHGGFHGRTMGALAFTGQPGKQEPFLPLPGDVTHVPYGDAQALAAAVTEDTALVIIEPIQGENGVVVPRPATSRPPARSPPPPAASSSSTRCRPASAAPGPGSPTRTTKVSCRTSSPSRRASAADCRSARPSPSAGPPSC